MATWSAPVSASTGPLRRLRRLAPYLGPAFLVSVGYMDPGNWATDIEGGAQFGYTLLWVLLLANLMALLLQYLSAKLGLATGLTYPQLCRQQFPRPLSFGLWVTAEGAALATDLAEFLGAALGLLPAAAHPDAARGARSPPPPSSASWPSIASASGLSSSSSWPWSA